MTDANPLTLYNSLTRQKEQFIPQDPKRVTMYNCGPTVYSYAHIGNARAAVVADVLFRVLRHIYGEDHVRYARNLTDIDDKIIKAATDAGVDISVITEKFAKIYQDDLKALNCLEPTEEPKATVHIPDMIAMISDLIEKGHAYESDGHVFFDVSTYEAYGKLSGNTLDALRGGDRVGEGEVARKKNSADFVLWKPELDGVGWDAPFGRGRPGWHIECSAMAKATLGEVIDIHCGGVDLKFPHHENEIAQSCCANEEQVFANYWVHNEFLNMGSEKMSKSLGNVTLVHDLLKEWNGEVIRWALLTGPYRLSLEWSDDRLNRSKERLDLLYDALRVSEPLVKIKEPRRLNQIFDRLHNDLQSAPALSNLVPVALRLRDFRNKIVHGQPMKLKGEIQTPEATLEIFSQLYADYKDAANQLGFLLVKPSEWFDEDTTEFDAIALRRQEARAAKDWPAADAARDEATARGIVLEDGPDGTTWRKA